MSFLSYFLTLTPPVNGFPELHRERERERGRLGGGVFSFWATPPIQNSGYDTVWTIHCIRLYVGKVVTSLMCSKGLSLAIVKKNGLSNYHDILVGRRRRQRMINILKWTGVSMPEIHSTAADKQEWKYYEMPYRRK